MSHFDDMSLGQIRDLMEEEKPDTICSRSGCAADTAHIHHDGEERTSYCFHHGYQAHLDGGYLVNLRTGTGIVRGEHVKPGMYIYYFGTPTCVIRFEVAGPERPEFVAGRIVFVNGESMTAEKGARFELVVV